MKTLINTFLINREEFIVLYEQFATIDPKMKVYDFNPLLMKPIVTSNGSDLLFPMPFSIFIAVTEGMYQQICTAKGLEFKSAFGKHPYEDYIEHILKLHNYLYIKEFVYRFQKNNLRSPDFMLVKNNHVIIDICALNILFLFAFESLTPVVLIIPYPFSSPCFHNFVTDGIRNKYGSKALTSCFIYTWRHSFA